MMQETSNHQLVPDDADQAPPVAPHSDDRVVPPGRSAESIVASWWESLDELTRLLRDESTAAPPARLPIPADFLLSVVVPVYNEVDTIETVVARIERLPVPKEIILVDDGSTDGTRERLATWTGHRVLLKPVNEGKGAALRDGFAAARGSIVVIQDADLEYHPADILRLLPPLLEGRADVVYGSRFLGEAIRDPSLIHRAGNALLTRLSNWTTGLRLTDMETCYKAFRRDVLHDLPLVQNRFGFEPEITAKLARRGCRFCEVPVDYAARGYDEGKKIGWRDGLNAVYCILRYGWRD